MGVNESTIEEHIKKIGLPHTWGTHIEVLAMATLYEISVYMYVTQQSPTGCYYWEEVNPSKQMVCRIPLCLLVHSLATIRYQTTWSLDI